MSVLTSGDLVFYALALVAFVGAVGVVVSQNPIFSAFYLALSMLAVAGLFVTLDAFFIAGVQLIVYAGAVMVLFVMVLMLFDLKHEMKTYSKGLIANGLKLATTGVIFGMFVVFIWYTFSTEPSFKPLGSDAAKTVLATKALANSLFTDYLFGFEAIGALLLMIAVGTVTLSRISGGTHAD
jgi:NADH-quinone oxidoreductase subunit J